MIFFYFLFRIFNKSVTGVFIYYFLVPNVSYSQHWDWVQTIKVNGSWGGHHYAWSMCNDPAGNTFVTGRVKGYSYFGNSGNDSTTSPIWNSYWGYQTDLYIVKYNPTGELVWARQQGGPGPDWGRGISTDFEGNICVVGDFTDTAHFGSFFLSNEGAIDNRFIVVAKYDYAGNCLWAKKAGGPNGHSRGYKICVDEKNNIYITGFISNIVNFDSITTGTSGKMLGFIAKYNTDGVCLWAKQIYASGGSISEDIQYKNGNLYLTGGFGGTIWFEGTSFTGINQTWDDVFVAKYDTAGTYQWAAVGIGNYKDLGNAVAVDSKENVYISGYYYYQLIFDTDTLYNPNINTTSNLAWSFIAKYNKTGEFLWARSIGDSSLALVNDMVVDVQDNVTVAGVFSDTIKFDTILLYSSPATVFVAQLNDTGNFNWVKTTNNIKPPSAEAITISSDIYGNFYCGGYYGDSLFFDSSLVIVTPEPPFAFIAKLMPPLNPQIPSSQVFVCSGDSVYFFCSASGSPLTYSWIIQGGNKPSSSENGFYVKFDSTGTFSFIVVVANPYSSDSVSGIVTVFPKTYPIVNLGSDATVCAGFELNAGNGFIQYIWSDNSTGQYMTVDSSGQYSVEIADSNYCKNRDTVNLIVNPAPSVSLGNDTMLCSTSITLDAGTGYESYLWSNGAITQSISVSVIGLYWVDVENSYPCTATDTVLVDSCLPVIYVSSVKSLTVSLIPNPVHESAYFILHGNVPPGNIRIELVDILGNTVSVIEKEPVFRSPDESYIRFNYSTLAPSIYLYKIYSDSIFLATGKLIIE